MNLHKHQLYLFEQHSESFKSWSAIIRINTEGKSLIMKLGRVIVIVEFWSFLTKTQTCSILWIYQCDFISKFIRIQELLTGAFTLWNICISEGLFFLFGSSRIVKRTRLLYVSRRSFFNTAVGSWICDSGNLSSSSWKTEQPKMKMNYISFVHNENISIN